MQGRRGWFGPRLPIAPSEPPKTRCARNTDPRIHGDPIRFTLVRYNRPVGSILLCGECFTELNPRHPADPLDVTAA